MRLATEDVSSEALMERACDEMVGLFNLAGAAVMATGDDRNRLILAVSDAARSLEQVQEAVRFGPCHDVATSGQRLIVDVADRADTWPRFAEIALSNGIKTVVAIPLISRGRCWGVLDLYGHSQGGWTEESLTAAQMFADGMTAHVVVAADRGRAALAEVQLQHQVTHDQQTGLANRVLFVQQLQQHLDHSSTHGTEVAVLLVDLEDFEVIAERHGLRAADYVLREVSQRLSSLVVAQGLCARLAPSTFAVVQSQAGRPDGASLSTNFMALAERVHHVLGAPFELEYATVSLSPRVGIAVCGSAMDAETLLDEADHALFTAARTGERTGTVEFGTSASGLVSLASEQLPSALENDALVVHYQPIVQASAPIASTPSRR